MHKLLMRYVEHMKQGIKECTVVVLDCDSWKLTDHYLKSYVHCDLVWEI